MTGVEGWMPDLKPVKLIAGLKTKAVYENWPAGGFRFCRCASEAVWTTSET
jgi:hypothetical protein